MHIALFNYLVNTTPLHSFFHALILTIVMMLTELIIILIFSNISFRYYNEMSQYQDAILLSIVTIQNPH